MERIITARSLRLDKAESELTELGRSWERSLISKGIIYAPLFSALIISPSPEGGRLGYFEAPSRLIVISEAVLDSASASDARSIMLHELAHALDYALHGFLSGHSPSFRECCRMLGLDPGFEKSRVRLSAAERNGRKDRIRKLLALSSSPFENEASEAIRKAKALMAKEGIDLEEDSEERICMVPLHEGRRFPFSIRMLLSYISETTGVYIVTSSCNGLKTAMAYGSLDEVEASIYLYDYLVSSSRREIAKLRGDGERIFSDSFLQGVIASLRERTADAGTDSALMVIRDGNMRKAKSIVFRDAKLRTTRTRSRGGDASSYGRGRSFGSSLDIGESRRRRELKSD